MQGNNGTRLAESVIHDRAKRASVQINELADSAEHLLQLFCGEPCQSLLVVGRPRELHESIVRKRLSFLYLRVWSVAGEGTSYKLADCSSTVAALLGEAWEEVSDAFEEHGTNGDEYGRQSDPVVYFTSERSTSTRTADGFHTTRTINAEPVREFLSRLRAIASELDSGDGVAAVERKQDERIIETRGNQCPMPPKKWDGAPCDWPQAKAWADAYRYGSLDFYRDAWFYVSRAPLEALPDGKLNDQARTDGARKHRWNLTSVSTIKKRMEAIALLCNWPKSERKTGRPKTGKLGITVV